MTMRLHAARVGSLGLLVILMDVVQAIQRPTHGPNKPSDRRTRSGASAASRDGASCGADGRTPDASDGGVLHHPDGLVPLTGRCRRILVTFLDGRLRRDCGGRVWGRGW